MSVYGLQGRLDHASVHVNAFDPGLVPGTGLAKNYPPFLKFISNYILIGLILFHPNVNTSQNSGKRLADLSYSDLYKNAKGTYFEGTRVIKSSADSYHKEYQDILWVSTIGLLEIKQNETSVSLI